MPYIIKNGKTYTGNSVTLTQAQYDALSTAEKNNGTAYYIYDSDAVLDASDVGLGEGNVEDLAGSVAVIETSPTVTNHVVGEHILWNGQLYEVISAIGAGADLTVNTNISATSVGEELSSLKNGLKYSSEHTETSNGLTLYYRTMGNICFGYVYGTPSNASTVASFTVPTAVEGYYYTGGQWAEASNPIQAWIDTGSNTFQVRNYVASRTVRVSFMYLCN